MIDWSACEDVERTPGKVSGQWVIRGTRIPAQAVIDNAADGGVTAEQIAAENYEGLPVEPARRVIEFAKESRGSGSCVKVLLDQNAPRQLRSVLSDHDVRSAYQMGWDKLTNGDLLDAAQRGGFRGHNHG